jgi:hypothetical protein
MEQAVSEWVRRLMAQELGKRKGREFCENFVMPVGQSTQGSRWYMTGMK